MLKMNNYDLKLQLLNSLSDYISDSFLKYFEDNIEIIEFETLLNLYRTLRSFVEPQNLPILDFELPF